MLGNIFYLLIFGKSSLVEYFIIIHVCVFLHLLVRLINHLSGFAPFSLIAQTVLHLALLGQPGSMPLLVSPGLNSWTTSVHYLYSRYRGAALFPWLTSSATLCRWCPSIYSLSSWLCCDNGTPVVPSCGFSVWLSSFQPTPSQPY